MEEATGEEHPEEPTASGQTYLPGTASLVQEIDSRYRGNTIWAFSRIIYGSIGLQHCCMAIRARVLAWYSYCSPPRTRVHAERLLVMLRDGKTLIGYLRSVDQFGEYEIHTVSSLPVYIPRHSLFVLWLH